MTESITASDLQQYGNLRAHLKDLYIKIKNGKREVQAGADDFDDYYNKLFPDSSTTYTDKLAYASNGLTTMGANAISLKKLLHNTLYPVFNQTKNNGPTASYATISNSHITAATGNKDHLCFIKLNADATDIEPDKYSITNILYSKYAIEIFIRIIKALRNCYENHEKDIISLFSSSTQIFIVAKKLKSGDNDDPKGIFINNATNDANSPPIGIYLYIGNIEKFFKTADIVLLSSDAVEADASVKNTYIANATNIFTSSNKLEYTVSGTGKYYFGFLHYYNYLEDESKYPEQTGTSQTSIVNNIGGTMSKMTLKEAKISSGDITGATITKLKILKGSTIQKAVDGSGSTITNTYKITSGNISGIVQGGFTLTAGAIIDTDSIKNVTVTANSVFSPTTSGSGETKNNTTIIRPKTSTITSGSPIISDSVSLTSTNVTNFQFTTAEEIPFTTGTHILPNNYDAYDVTGRSITTIRDVIVSAPEVTIAGTFDKLTASSKLMGSYYEQNIYYIYNFIKMINNIDNNSFSTTLQYLEVNLLCYKALLLSSIRAANIFYNNRHKISALAISYEKDFLNNANTITGSGVCANLALIDFVKNDYRADFGATCVASATGIKLPEDTTVSATKYQYILYKKSSGASTDNDTIFKDYDVRIQQEINSIKNSDIAGSTTNLGIDNFQLCHSFKVLSPFKISTDNGNTNDTLESDGILKDSGSDSDYLTIINMFEYNKKHDFNKNYRIKIVGTTFKAISFNIIPDATNKRRIEIELEQSNDIPPNLLNNLNKSSGATQITENVYIVKITSGDIDKDYNNIVSNTDTVEQNINMYKTKIKNNTTLYELHKSRNNLLYNQVMSYLIIVGVLIAILVIINIANVEKPLIKSITLGCLVVIIILFMSYYIMNTLYIEEGFTDPNNMFIGYDLCPTDSCKVSSASSDQIKNNEYHTDIITNKKNYVKNFLNTNAKELMLMIILKSPSIVNDSLKGNNEKLVTISKNIYNEKLYLNDVLYSKKSDSEMNVDVLKYENKNYDVYIVCILFLALIMVGSYTVNIYTDNKYMDLLILIMVILFVCLFTYFVLYTNRIVRTVSTNYYWGNQYENEYI
uniref:Uncharacterized protein n=1 Tax=viral metagenome TaxID=1070528 RepID=A0A6C0LAT1_9ZZZZ